MNKKSFKKGFTLIEMLVVIAVIGILASIVVLGTGSARTKARDTKRIADVKQIQNGLEATYQTSDGTYDCTRVANMPTDPQGAAYGCEGGTSYRVWATLEKEENNPTGGGIEFEVTSGDEGGGGGGSGRE